MNAASVFGGFCLLEGESGYVDVLRQGDKDQDKGKAQRRKGGFSFVLPIRKPAVL